MPQILPRAIIDLNEISSKFTSPKSKQMPLSLVVFPTGKTLDQMNNNLLQEDLPYNSTVVFGFIMISTESTFM